MQEKLLSGDIVAYHIGTKEQLTDLLSKALNVKQFTYLVDKLGILDFHIPT